MILLLWACAGAAPDTAADTAAAWPCPGEPVITYANWGDGFLAAYCDSCHTASAPDRHGAPESVTFDSEAELSQWAERILIRVLDEDDMPPGGGVTGDDLTRLDVLLRCGLR